MYVVFVLNTFAIHHFHLKLNNNYLQYNQANTNNGINGINNTVHSLKAHLMFQ